MTRLVTSLAVALAVLLSGCAASHRLPTVAITAPPTSTTVHASQWPAPDNTLTPGALTPNCVTPRPQAERTIGAADHAKLDTAYHYIGRHGLTHLEYDHRIPFALCGSNAADNVWPEIADGVKQSRYIHNYKDQLEDTIISKWHAHKLTLTQAQDVFRGDWRHAWCQWVHTPGVTCDI